MRAAVLFAPIVVMEVLLWQPFVASTFASTAAIALHDPTTYRRDHRRIARCYALAFAGAVPVSLAGAALALPTVLPAAVTAVVLVAARIGRFHPPVACVPFAVALGDSPARVAVGWLTVFVATAYLLLTLGVLTRAVRPVDRRVEKD